MDRHIDFLAVRLGSSREKVGVDPNQRELGIDNDLLLQLGVNEEKTIGLVIEVKGGNKPVKINSSQFAYAKSFFGKIKPIKKVSFENSTDLEISQRNDQIVVPLKYCMNFIKYRFSELKSIENEYKGKGLLSKEGSWTLSEKFLSDLIYLKKLNCLNE